MVSALGIEDFRFQTVFILHRFDGEGRGGGGGGMGRGRARGMGRGRGRGRGGPGGIPGGMDNRGKREYDRQSGMATTGVKPMDKREGSGSFNWGSDRDQIEEQLNATPNELDTSAETPEKVLKSIIYIEIMNNKNWLLIVQVV